MSSPSGSTPRSPGTRRRSQLAGANGAPDSPSSPLRRTSRPSTSQYASPTTAGTPSRRGRDATAASSSPRQAPRTSSSQRGTPSQPTARAGAAATPAAMPTPATTRRTPGGSQGAKAKEAIERDRLERQIREVNSDVERLSKQVQAQRGGLALGSVAGATAGELEDIVKGMDDGDLIALLTAPRSALASALPPNAEDALAPPPISAGIEGLGSGHTLDVVLTELRNGVHPARKRRRTSKGAGQDDAQDSQDEVESVRALLEARQERLQKLLAQLSAFTGMTLTEASSAGHARRTIAGVLSLPDELGDDVAFEASFDVVDERIEGVELDVDRSVREALERDKWLTSAIDEANLPGILQALRSLPQLALARRTLFSSLARAYPQLCADYLERLGDAPGQDSPVRKGRETLRDAFDPARAETLSFVNERSAQLDLTFAITFNPFGHASPRFSISASLPRGTSQSTQDLIETLPERFAALIAGAGDEDTPTQTGVQTESAVRATVEAFFGL